MSGFRVMDRESEDMLQAILEQYNGNDKNYVNFTTDNLPEHLQKSFSLECEKLQMYGVVSSANVYTTGAMIVISKNFFGRERTEKELHEFLSRQNTSEQKIVLPLLHGITLEELKEHYPELGDIQCINSDDYSKKEITIFFARELIKRYKIE